MKGFLYTILIIGIFIMGLFIARIVLGLLIMLIGQIGGEIIEFIGNIFK